MTQRSDTQPDRDPETLELFIEESLDALQQVEKLLVDAEAGSPCADMTSVLFRHFHTIKGTSGFLGFDGILGLSHVAEDLLSKLREKTIRAQPDHFAHLMEVGDPGQLSWAMVGWHSSSMSPGSRGSQGST